MNKIVIVIAGMALIQGCATKSSVDQLTEKVSSLDSQVETLKSQTHNLVSVDAVNQKETDTKINVLKTEVNTISNTQAHVGELVEKIDAKINLIGKQTNKITKKLFPAKAKPAKSAAPAKAAPAKAAPAKADEKK